MNQGFTVEFGDFRFETATQELVGWDGQTRPLRAQSAQVLAVFAMHPNEVVSKDALFEAVWPGVSVTDDSLTQCIVDIRKAIGDTERKILRTIPKKGYQLVATRTVPLPREEPARPSGFGRHRRATIGVFALALFAIALLGVWRMQPAAPVAQANASKASITVLPFTDLSPDRDLGHFADGMTEDLITDLARWKEFQVTARNSAMTYKDQRIDVRQVARDMNTRYVLEGSVRRFGDEMRITAQLIDGETGNHVWARRFEETDSDVLALQDNVIGRIVQSLIGNHGVVREDEYAKTWARAEADLDEYDYYLRGHTLFYRFTPEDNAKAIEVWQAGLARHPDSGLLKIKLGWGYLAELIWYSTETPHSIETVYDLVREGMSDPQLPPAGHRFGLWLLSEVYVVMGDRTGVVDTVNEVVHAYPFDSEGLMVMVGPTTAVGEYVFADKLAAKALVLGYRPDPPDYADFGSLRYSQGDCPQAITFLEKAIQTNVATLLLAGCYAESGRIPEAKDLLAKAAAEFRITSADDFPGSFRTMPGVTDRLTAQLAKADWPAPVSKSPAIIVLPFRNLSGDASLAHFSDGVTEDLLTGLSRWKDFQVVDRTTSMSFKGSGLTIAEIGKRTQTQYALEGSVRRIGEKMRVTAQLVDTKSGRNIWAQRYDESASDIFQIYDAILTRVEKSLIGNTGVVQKDAQRKSWARSGISLDEYDYVLRVHSLIYEFTPDALVRALEVLDEAEDRFPDSGYLKIKRGWVHTLCNRFACGPEAFDIADTKKLLSEGLSDRQLSPMGRRHGLWLRGFLAGLENDAFVVETNARTLAEEFPSDVEGLLFAARDLVNVGKFDLAGQLIDQAGDLNQRPMPHFYFYAAYYQYALGDCIAAKPYLEAGPFLINGLIRAGCYVEFGQLDRAHAELQTLEQRLGVRTFSDLESEMPHLPRVRARLETQLAQVGWPAPARERPSIIVLPFRDLSPDASLAHFADGVTEDLITGLSRWKDFQVVDRTTAMSFRGSGLTIAQIAERTQTQYALEGSIRRLGDTMRITAQLVDAATGRNVWAQSYDETEADILSMHNGIFDRIERSLIGTMGVVHTAEFRKSWARSPMRLDEYDYVLRGHSLFYEFTPDDMARALQIWNEGQDRFPDSSYLKIKRGWGRYLCNILRCSEGPFDYEGIADLLEEGLADPKLLAMGKRHGSWLRIALAAARGDADTASQTAIELAALYPSDVEGLLLAAQYTARAGAVDTAQKMVALAGPLNQKPMPYFYFDAAFVHYILDDCEAARPFLAAGPFPADGLMRAACYVEFGELDRARRELDRLGDKFGLRNLDTPLLDFLYLPDVQARLEATLAQVGWPE